MYSPHMNNLYKQSRYENTKVDKSLLYDQIKALNGTRNDFGLPNPGISEKNSNSELMRTLMPSLKAALERVHQQKCIQIKNMTEGSCKIKCPKQEQCPLPPSVIRASNRRTSLFCNNPPSFVEILPPPPPPPRTCSMKVVDSEPSSSHVNFERRFRFQDADFFPSPLTYGTEKVKASKSKGFASGFCNLCICYHGN